jgi:hypothetical protein
MKLKNIFNFIAYSKNKKIVIKMAETKSEG